MGKKVCVYLTINKYLVYKLAQDKAIRNSQSLSVIILRLLEMWVNEEISYLGLGTQKTMPLFGNRGLKF